MLLHKMLISRYLVRNCLLVLCMALAIPCSEMMLIVLLFNSFSISSSLSLISTSSLSPFIIPFSSIVICGVRLVILVHVLYVNNFICFFINTLILSSSLMNLSLWSSLFSVLFTEISFGNCVSI